MSMMALRVAIPNRVINPTSEATDSLPNGLVFEFALLSGMRPEEYLALRWPDVDFERGAASIQRALVRHKKVWSFENPKTPRSRRTLTLPSLLLHKLANHKRNPAEERLKA